MRARDRLGRFVDPDSADAVEPVSEEPLPPKRTPTSYVTKFAWTGPSLPVTTGELVLSYAPGSAGPATTAVLTLDSEGVEISALAADDLQAMCEGFLDNLARAAEGRSRAA